MAGSSRGRGTALGFGIALLVIGIVGAIVLWIMAERRPGDAVDSFARAPVGCTTRLRFDQTGTFYVYEETGGPVEPPAGDCVPAADPSEPFSFTIADDTGEPIVHRRDDTVSYDVDGRAGTSVGRVQIADAGEYSMTVRGDDVSAVAAVGRNPTDGVSDLRAGAVAIGIAGVLLGSLLLLFSRLAKPQPPSDVPEPGWGPWPDAPTGSWPPQPPKFDVPSEVPPLVTPPADLPPPPPPGPVPTSVPVSPWAPPSAGDRR